MGGREGGGDSEGTHRGETEARACRWRGSIKEGDEGSSLLSFSVPETTNDWLAVTRFVTGS